MFYHLWKTYDKNKKKALRKQLKLKIDAAVSNLEELTENKVSITEKGFVSFKGMEYFKISVHYK
jgi:hypothetical protein